MVECAVREAFEETGMHLLNDADAGEPHSVGTLRTGSSEIQGCCCLEWCSLPCGVPVLTPCTCQVMDDILHCYIE